MSADGTARGSAHGRRLGALLGAAAVVLGALGAVLSTGAAPASAHDFLETASPAADSVVTEPLTEVTLGFNAPPLTDFASAIAIEVHNPAGTNVATGEVRIVDSTLSITVAPNTAGAYTVLWQTVSSDGHPVSGEYAFDYQGPVTDAGASTPTEGAADDGTADAATPSDAGTPTASPAPTPAPTLTVTPDAADPGTTSTPAPDVSGTSTPAALVWIGVAAGLAVLAVVAVVIVLTLRRRPAA